MRFGVFGTAHWAETIHLPGLKSAPDVELVAVGGRNSDRVETLARSMGIEGFTDFASMLDHVDAVSFAVPPDVQPPLAEIAARAGKHIILEKPPARSVDEASRLSAAIMESGVSATCFLTRRFIPEVIAFVAQGRAQQARFAEAHFSTSALSPGSPYANSVWRKEELATLWDLGPHALTPLIEMLGAVETVSATRADGFIQAELFHEGGKKSSFTLSQRGEAGTFKESYGFSDGVASTELVVAGYDRLAAYRAAVSSLLENRGTEAPAQGAMFAMDMVSVLVAAERSVRTGGDRISSNM